MVSDSVSKKFGIGKSIGFGIENIWYRKKYWIRYRKIWYRKKVSDSVSFRFWVSSHTASNPLSRQSRRLPKSDNAHKNVTVNFLLCGPSTIGTWLEMISAWNHIAHALPSVQLTVVPLQMIVPNGATMTAPIGILKGTSNSTIHLLSSKRSWGWIKEKTPF